MTDHISQQFDTDMEELKSDFLAMGGLVEHQLRDAIDALIDGDSESAEAISKKDMKINEMEIQIDEECRQIIARRQPAAGDLRIVMAVSKAVTDLERIGDEASKISRHATQLASEGSAPRGYREVRHIGNHVRQMLYDSLDSFARRDVEMALKVIQEELSVDGEYNAAIRQLMTYMMEDPRNMARVLNVIWALRALERVGDHARNIAEFVIYMVEGMDVRHQPLEELRSQVQ